MSASVYLLVQFVNGKPQLTLGPTPKVRSFTRRGTAEKYARELVEAVVYRNGQAKYFGREQKPLPDIRVLSIAIPQEGPVGDGMWPNLVPELAVKWA